MSITAEQAAAMVAKAVADATAPLVDKVAALAAPPAASPPPAAPEPKLVTRADLEQAVASGRISEQESAAIWDRQQAEQTALLVRKTVAETVSNVQLEGNIEARIAEYSALKPDVLKAGTTDRQRVEAQYAYLVSIGQPKTKSTELAALGMVYGSIDGLKAAAAGRPSTETHEDIGGGGEPSPGGKTPKKLKLSGDEERYYRQGIEKGLYKDWDAVEAELKFASARTRAKHGAPLH
ncbi:MAG: hypothetical protein AB7I42_26035 [Bradyrhizobium sp.]|uniref:hypothetical protein n=1 Tax=Bradyrhizobium sp. TaxID=376 RepID=UPI003D0D6007